MASQAYYDWVAAGRPYYRSVSVMQLRDVLRSHGYTVYDYPDEAHQKANLPEDHTAYSATGWPVKSPRWWAFGIDQMPGKGGMADLARCARQIIKDKDAGVPGTEFIKYINWTDENGNCWHTSWKPNKSTVKSTDKGHNHISGRSDFTDDVTVRYDPIDRMNGLASEGLDEEEVALIARGSDGQLYKVQGGFSHKTQEESIPHILYLWGQQGIKPARGPIAGDKEWETGGIVRKGWTEDIFGALYVKPVPVEDSSLPVDVATVKAGVTAALKDEDNQSILVDTSFKGAQKAEQE